MNEIFIEINKAEIRTCEWILSLFARPEIWSPHMIENVILEYKDKLNQKNETLINSGVDSFDYRQHDANELL